MHSFTIGAALAFAVSGVQGECSGTADMLRYASTTDRFYVESSVPGQCATLTDIYNADVKDIPLYVLDDNMEIVEDGTPTGKWLLSTELYVEDGSTLVIHNEELYIRSDSETPALNLRAHGGNLDIYRSKIYGWDYNNKQPDNDPEKETGRAYISCVSEIVVDSSQECDGRAKETMGECRMDIIESEIGYLGYQNSESYGLTWKVRGFCKDKSNLEIFDQVQVRGDLKDSDIHHLWFGLYTYGHEGGVWINNEMHDNWKYGFDPHDDSDNLLIENNKVWNNGDHGIIASKRCNNVKILNNEVWNGQNAGIFLHRSSDGAEVAYNNVYSNGDAGLAIMESFDLNVHHNTFSNNKYGVRISVGGGTNLIKKNTFHDIWQYTMYTYKGSDLPDVPNTTGRPVENKFIKNTLTGNHPYVIYLKEADGTRFKKNDFSGVANEDATASFIDSTATVYKKNLDEMITIEEDDSCFKKIKTYTDFSGSIC
ncbi:unnamed protein product [Choristocarpus tenellus]